MSFSFLSLNQPNLCDGFFTYSLRIFKLSVKKIAKKFFLLSFLKLPKVALTKQKHWQKKIEGEGLL